MGFAGSRKIETGSFSLSGALTAHMSPLYYTKNGMQDVVATPCRS